MAYRKGERPIAKTVRAYTADHPVARWISDGDHWLTAWVGQSTTSWITITKKTGISRERLWEFQRGADPTEAEIEKLAALWWVTPAGLRDSINEASGGR